MSYFVNVVKKWMIILATGSNHVTYLPPLSVQL